MLIRRTMRGPVTASFQIAVRTVLPSHSTSRGPPTLRDSRRLVMAPGTLDGSAAPAKLGGLRGDDDVSRHARRLDAQEARRPTGQPPVPAAEERDRGRRQDAA